MDGVRLGERDDVLGFPAGGEGAAAPPVSERDDVALAFRLDGDVVFLV